MRENNLRLNFFLGLDPRYEGSGGNCEHIEKRDLVLSKQAKKQREKKTAQAVKEVLKNLKMSW